MYRDNTVSFDESKINTLKKALPSIISSCPGLKKESTTSYAGQCPRCGGTNRFVYKTDSERCWCRQCHPEKNSMDVIDFHCWLYGKEIKDLIREYLPEQTNHGQDKSTPPPDIKTLFCEKRCLSPDIIASLPIKYKFHAGMPSAEIPFTDFNGNLLATQFLTLNQEPYPFTLNNKPAKKVFLKGSKPGDDCFFQCGTPVKDASVIVISESVINAITVIEYMPGVCSLAIGSSIYTKKIKALVPFLPGINQVIACQDNDKAGQKMVQDAYSILKEKVYSIKWQDSDKPKIDINDLLRAGQKERIIDMLNNACQVSDKKTPSFITAKEILQQNPKTISLIDGFANQGEGMIIHAEGGVGKSAVSLYIATECAKETQNQMTPNLLFDEFAIRKQMTSLFIQSENSAAVINTRLRGLLGKDEESWAILENLFFPDISQDVLTIGKTFEDEHFLQYCIQLIQGIEEQSKKKLDLFFVDPLVSFHNSDENDAGRMRAALDGITEIVKQTGITPIVLHHDNRNGNYRGSSAVFDWCRNMISLKRTFIGEDRITDFQEGKPIKRVASIPAIEFKHEKANNLPKFTKFTMVMNQDFSFTRVADTLSSKEREKCLNVRQALEDLGGFAESNRELARTVSEKSGQGITTCKKDIALAVENGVIKTERPKGGGTHAYCYRLDSA